MIDWRDTPHDYIDAERVKFEAHCHDWRMPVIRNRVGEYVDRSTRWDWQTWRGIASVSKLIEQDNEGEDCDGKGETN